MKDELVNYSKLTIIFFLVQNHIIADLLPLSEIEKEGFQELIGGLIGPLVIKSRRSMMELLNKKYESTKGNLIAELQKAEYVCTTADCWTAHKRSFLGMTAHWHSEDQESKEIVRRSACLGVRRIYGSHTHDVIAKAISDFHADFQISYKVNCTITDNGSNFLKAFKMFSSVTPQDQDNISRRSDGDEYQEDEFIDEEDDDENVVYIEIGEILNHGHQNHLQTEGDEENEQRMSIGNENTGEDDVDSDQEESQIRLPRHFRCTCHTLNLIATTDVKNIVNQRFSKLKKQLDAKLSAIWNKQSRSALASDYIKKIMGELFVIHNATRWNSYYDALRKVQHFITHKFAELQMVFDHFKVKRMTTAEMEFLKEFIKVMKPIADALDVFQNESKMSVGCVLPVLTLLKEKLKGFQEDRSFTHCVPLITCLIDGVQRRFGKLFDDDFMRLAAISDPHFKLTWSPEEKKTYDTDLLKREVKRRGNATLE